MAKRDTGTQGKSGGNAADAMEERILEFAEHLGRMVGTLHAKSDALLDRETLHQQITSVRDRAAHLLEQLTRAATPPKKAPAAAPARRKTAGRSGDVVDAPGKRHRTPAPAGQAASKAGSQAAKLRAAKTMIKTNRHRGRG